MEVTQVAVRIQLRRDTAANWTTANPILRDGEMGIESDTLKVKVGNGTSTWSLRPYLNVTPSELAELAQDSVNSAIVAGVGLDKVYNDTANTITLDIDSTVSTKDYVDTAVASLGNSLPTSYVPLSLLDQPDGVATLNSSGDVPLTQLDPTVVITTSAQTLTNKTINANANTITVTSANVSDFNEAAQDAVGSILSSDLTYNDSTPGIALNYVTVGNTLLNGVSGASYGLIGTSAYLDVKDTNGYNKEIELDITAVETKLETDGFAKLASPTFTGTVTLPAGTITSGMILDGTILNVDINSSAAISLSKLETNPLDRVNHTGQQIAQTISDFNEAAQDAVGNAVGSGLTYSDASGAISVDLTTIQSRILNVTDTEIGYLDGVTSSIQTQLNDKAPLASPTFTGTVSGVTKSHVGLGNVDNTTDANKPVSTATQSALDLKANLAGPSFTGITNAVDLTLSGNLTLSGAPTSDLHAATKLYVDNLTAGINFHQSVHAASVTNLAVIYNNGTSGVGATLTADTNRAFAVLDGETVVLGERVLIKNQTDAKQNGIYTLTTVGSVSAPWVLTRATDADNNPTGEMKTGDFTFVQRGTVNASIGFINNSTASPIVIGTDNISYTEFNAGKTVVAGNGLSEATPGTLSINTGVTADLTTAQTLTNKTISGGSNTLSNIGNASLTNSSITIGSSPVSLGSTLSTIAGLTSVTSTTFVGSLTGNASTVTNGVVTTGSYSNPTWLSLDSTAVGLGNVENTAISTFPGSTAIVSLGIVTAGTWSADAILPTKGGTGLQSYTTGDIIYSSATNTLSTLAAGDNGQILTLASGVPTWAAAPITLPTQTSNSGKYLTTDGTTASWAVIPASYTAPTIGGVSITSGGTFSSFSNLTLTGDITVPEPTTNSQAATKLYTDTKSAAEATAKAAIERTYTNERLEIVPLDDVSTDFNGSNTRFIPKVGGTKITISNPLRLLVNINGIIQMLGNQDNHWLSPIAPEGFFIDSDGYMEFSEPVPTGSTFDARLMPGKTSNTLEKSRYPFRATDILLGA
jgi:hypothetical protein